MRARLEGWAREPRPALTGSRALKPFWLPQVRRVQQISPQRGSPRAGVSRRELRGVVIRTSLIQVCHRECLKQATSTALTRTAIAVGDQVGRELDTAIRHIHF